MGNFTERSKLFNAFIAIVFFAHGIQLVWNQPLITRQSPIASTPFNPDIIHRDSDSGISLPPPQASPTSSQAIQHSNEANMNPMEENNREPGQDNKDTSNSLCSIFRTFLDSRSVQCRVSRLNPGSEDVDSNALIQIRNPSGNKRADSRVDHFDNIHHGDEDQEKVSTDDTKILQDKTTIIVPDRPCPPGQRRDQRGYCRTVLRIHTYNGQQIGIRPVRYYYKRFVAIPTLHFIF